MIHKREAFRQAIRLLFSVGANKLPLDRQTVPFTNNKQTKLKTR